MNTILLTGGSGFIGSYFHKSLPHHQLINLDIAKPTFAYSSAYVSGDIRSVEDVRESVRGKSVKTIISLAAKHHDFGIAPEEYFDTNEGGIKVLCEVASEFNIKEIVFFSSVAVYGNCTDRSTEVMAPNPTGPYGASKLAGEKILESWARQGVDRKVLIIRPALVFGPDNIANMRNLIQQIDSGFYFHLGKGENIKSIAYVENLVNATQFLIENLKPGIQVYNYADEPQLSTRQLSITIAQALRKKIWLTIPKSIGVLIGIPFDMFIKLTGRNLAISSARIKKLGTQTYHSGQKIRDEGFKPIHSTVDGIHKMVAWYKQQKANAR